ncbi:hypothetical protein QA596_00780 [Balneolales bacterium ANBcel1]|nr:hypothetical protein [Balneolales bacterium ANBcel1]
MRDRIQVIDFWSGNRSSVRRDYERDVLTAALHATRQEYGAWKLVERMDDYPGNMESSAFRKYGHDLFVTTAGNRKMSKEDKTVIYHPILNNLLGYRVIIIREEDQDHFAQIDSSDALKRFKVGIPELWTDADLLRHNGFTVIEKGGFDELFANLRNGEFAFTTLGINEVDGVFAEREDELANVTTVGHLLIHYPLPLLFYVNPDEPELAARIARGMRIISADRTMDRLFADHNKGVMEKIGLSRRKIIRLENPMLPKEIADLQTDPVTADETSHR